MQIKGDVIISDLLDINPEFEKILLEQGMHCLGCPASRGETLAEACEIHGVDVDKLLEQLNGADTITE